MIWIPKKEIIRPRRQQGFFTLPGGMGASKPGPPPTDPLFANVVSLLHFDGTNGSTTFTDQKGITWTANGNAQITTSQSLYGSGSGQFDGNNDYLTASHASLALGSGDFCIEIACRKIGNGVSGNNSDLILLDWRSAEPQQQMLIGYTGSTNGTIGGNRIYVFLNGSYVISAAAAVSAWRRACVERVSSTITLYVDGTSVGTTSNSSNFSNSTLTLSGRFAATGGDRRSFNGQIDELRITTGAHRHAGNYTPTGPFPNS